MSMSNWKKSEVLVNTHNYLRGVFTYLGPFLVLCSVFKFQNVDTVQLDSVPTEEIKETISLFVAGAMSVTARLFFMNKKILSPNSSTPYTWEDQIVPTGKPLMPFAKDFALVGAIIIFFTITHLVSKLIQSAIFTN